MIVTDGVPPHLSHAAFLQAKAMQNQTHVEDRRRVFVTFDTFRKLTWDTLRVRPLPRGPQTSGLLTSVVVVPLLRLATPASSAGGAGQGNPSLLAAPRTNAVSKELSSPACPAHPLTFVTRRARLPSPLFQQAQDTSDELLAAFDRVNVEIDERMKQKAAQGIATNYDLEVRLLLWPPTLVFSFLPCLPPLSGRRPSSMIPTESRSVLPVAQGPDRGGRAHH